MGSDELYIGFIVRFFGVAGGGVLFLHTDFYLE